METEELKGKIYAFVEKAKGKKKLKEKDIMKGIEKNEGVDKAEVKAAMRELINVGKLMYSYGGGASSVEIPSDEYLREKGML
jgi:hypothetical protein